MVTLTTTQMPPSLLGGVVIIGGIIIDVGMFPLPVVMPGAWFSWSMAVLISTWFCVLHPGLMILEVSLNYRIGSSFDTIMKDLPSKGWNAASGISITFVLYILTYTYISVSGPILHHIFSKMSLNAPAHTAGPGFASLMAFMVWLNTKTVSRMTAIVLDAKVITFFLTFGGLLGHVQSTALSNVAESDASYTSYLLMMLLFYLVSFGYHDDIPSLMKHYDKDPRIIIKCLVCGTPLALVLYTAWLPGTMGNIPCLEFTGIAQQGGNIDVLVRVLSGILNSRSLDLLLVVFSNPAVASPSLDITLGLFSYLADLFGFDNPAMGRFKTALLTSVPPTIGGLLWLNGFLYAIDYAEPAVTIWAAIVPALLARKFRKCFNSPEFRVWGGKPMTALILVFGVDNVVIRILSSVNLSPIYQQNNCPVAPRLPGLKGLSRPDKVQPSSGTNSAAPMIPAPHPSPNQMNVDASGDQKSSR